MFWFVPKIPNVVFINRRREAPDLPNVSRGGGSRSLIVDPDIQADFRALPFRDDTFAHVFFDPPHLVGAGKKGWLALKYGVLEGDWREDLRKGFAECFRVLKPGGTL